MWITLATNTQVDAAPGRGEQPLLVVLGGCVGAGVDVVDLSLTNVTKIAQDASTVGVVRWPKYV